MTLTTEQLNQIKADISARKAMPEYGESVEGNIERLRVIGATRSHFSTETVEMLVRALEEKSRALADAEHERDDWVEHSRRMEHRAIEEKELLANREAQPVAATPIYQIWDDDGWCDTSEQTWRETYDDFRKEQYRIVYTAPPAPAPAVQDDYFGELVKKARSAADKAMRKFPQPNYVLNKVAEESGEVIKAVIHYTEGREEWANVEGEIIDNLAMLIRLVVEGDQVIGFIPPDSCRAAMLPAAPGVGNDHDTRR